MATKIDQKAYLQKYLTGKSADKKKKKKKVSKGTGFKIIDDDIDLTKLRTLDGDELDILDNGEDAPQIAGIIDERPEDVRKMEQYNVNSKWRVINQDDGFNSKLQIQEIQKDVKEQVKENELIFGKMYSDSEDETEKKNDSDASPPRKQSNSNQKPRTSKKPQNNSDSDFSPPRQKDDRKNSKKSDGTRKRESSPSKRQDDKRSKEKHSKNYDSDLSPPRKHDIERKKERSRKASRWGDFEQEKKEYMSKASTSRNWSDSDASPPRKTTKNYDSDQSPPRKSRKDSPSRNKRQKSPDSDMSPPRKRKQSPEKPQRRRKSTDSDLSPPRKNRKESRRKSPDSDLSPPRKSRVSPSRNSRFRNGDKNDSPPPSNRKMAKTLEGKAAGLQSATLLREENDAFKRREDEAFSRLADEVSGRNAKVAYKRAGKRESSAERVKQKEKAERQKELDEKYKKWSKGLKQVEATEARHQDFLHESSKPLARLAGDADLEAALRGAERPDDPMLQYVRRSRQERGDLPPEKPAYKGSFPPNRFNIRPGYRWDGVDRSSGYERKYFETQSKRKAQEEEYFKWSSADM